MAAPVELNATLVSRQDLTPALALFRVQPDVTPVATFEPGQYMTLGLNNTKAPEKGSVRRPMSIASAPDTGDVFEFYVRYVSAPASDNPLTHLLFELQAGDRLHLRASPQGRFTVAHTCGLEDTRKRILVAAGTGLAPFTSMVFDAARKDPSASLDQWAVLHGASYSEELGYRQELEKLARDRGLRDLPTISRPNERPDWTGARGRVEDFFLPERIADTEARLGLEPGGLNPRSCVVLICGLTGTVAHTIERLLARGFVPDHKRTKAALDLAETPSSVFFEQYDSTPLFDLKSESEVERLRALWRAT